MKQKKNFSSQMTTGNRNKILATDYQKKNRDYR